MLRKDSGVVGEGLRGQVSFVQRHLCPCSSGRDQGTDGWVTVWWRGRSKREITLLSLLLSRFPPFPPSVLLSHHQGVVLRGIPPQITWKETSSFLLALSLPLWPAGKFYTSIKLAAGPHNTVTLSAQSKERFFLINIKTWQWLQETQDNRENMHWEDGESIPLLSWSSEALGQYIMCILTNASNQKLSPNRQQLT